MERKTAAGIVLFHPDLCRLKVTLESVLGQIGHLYLVDNGSGCGEAVSRLIEGLPVSESYTFIENNENRGIAAALNQIMQAASDDGYDFVLTLDDDSRCDADMVRVLAHCCDYPHAGIICPEAVHDTEYVKSQSVSKTEEKHGHRVTVIEDCITAGSLTSVKAWKAVGGFDESMFIDFVDMDFCASIREKGYRVYRVSGTFIHQMYGNISGAFHLFGMTLYRLNYSPKRIYYSVRNQIYFIRKHADKGSIKVRSRILFLLGYMGKHLIFEGKRFSCGKAMIKGIRDGLRMPLPNED